MRFFSSNTRLQIWKNRRTTYSWGRLSERKSTSGSWLQRLCTGVTVAINARSAGKRTSIPKPQQLQLTERGGILRQNLLSWPTNFLCSIDTKCKKNMGPHEQVSIFISFDGQCHISQHEQVLISLDLHPGKIRCHSEPASWEAFWDGKGPSRSMFLSTSLKQGRSYLVSIGVNWPQWKVILH